MQGVTSANTSLNQIPSVWKSIDYENVERILDYGCGKYDKFKEFIESKGIEYFGYDKYNRSDEENYNALHSCPDLIVCANVLNVIDNTYEIFEILEFISTYNKPVVFSIYEGDKSGVGRVTKKDCYQRNQKTKDYVMMIELFFSKVKRKGNVIFAEN